MLDRRILAVLALVAGARCAAGDDTATVERSPELEIFDTRLIGEPAPPEPEREPDVVLLDPGAEPRRRLRYQIEPGTEERLVVTSSLVQRFEMDGNPLTKQSSPPTRLEVVLRARPGGAPAAQPFDLEFIQAQTIDYTRLMVARGDVLVKTVDSLPDIVVEVSDRGILDREQLEAAWPSGSTIEDAELAGLFGTLTGALQTALPEEEVGVGARWRVAVPDTMTDLPGSDAAQVLELTAMDGQRLEIVESSSFDLGEGGMPLLPEMKLASSGSGRRLLDLGRLAPLEYEATTTMSMSQEMRDGREVHRLDATIVLKIKGEGS